MKTVTIASLVCLLVHAGGNSQWKTISKIVKNQKTSPRVDLSRLKIFISKKLLKEVRPFRRDERAFQFENIKKSKWAFSSKNEIW